MGIGSLTMTYFHTGIRTIIGAKSFHCPVRDGKEWDQLAMVIRLKRDFAAGEGYKGIHRTNRGVSLFIDCVKRGVNNTVVITIRVDNWTNQ